MNNNKKIQKQDETALAKYQYITPLLDEKLDRAKKAKLRKEIAERNSLGVRTLYRWEELYRAFGFAGLRPMQRKSHMDIKNLSESYPALIEQAIMLKREVPTRSVAQIIMILELEGLAKEGVLKRSTLQRHLYNAGFGKKQIKKYTEARISSSKRFCKPNRMMLVQGDIKYGPYLPIGKNGAKKRTYLSALIDDHSRYIISSGFYDNQEKEIVEDTFHKAILKFGKPDCFYLDNGSQYISKQLKIATSKLGIRIKHAAPRSAASKGKIEVYNRFVNSFMAECKAKKIKTLEELNAMWEVWVEAYYHSKAHEGIREYYRSQCIEVPDEGITPEQEWNRDSRQLTFLDAGVVGEAFLHHETRIVDKGACISFKGNKFEVSTSLIGATVEIAYDPMKTDELTVSYPGIKSFVVKPLVIGQYCDPKPVIPASMLPVEPETSRLLDALAKSYEKKKKLKANAISFGSYKKQGGDD